MMNYRPTELRKKKPTALLAMLLIVLLTPTARAIDFTWTGGGINDDWDDPANWDMVGIPDGNDDTAVTTGTPELVANRILGDLTVNSGTVDLNGFQLLVQAVTHSGTVTLNSDMRVRSGPTSFDLDTDNLVVNLNGDLFIETNAVAQVDFDATINASGQVQLQGGEFEVGGTLDNNEGGEVVGNGLVQITGTDNWSNDGEVIASGGTLTLEATSTAVFDWDGAGLSTAVMEARTNSTLIIDITNNNDGFNGEILVGQNAEIQNNFAWNLEGFASQPGIMNLNGGTGTATISGADWELGTLGDQAQLNVNSGTGLIESNLTFTEGTATLADGATLQFDGTLTANAGTINVGTGAGSGTITFNDTATIGAGVDFNFVGSATEMNVNSTVTVNDVDWDWDANGAPGNVINIGDSGTLNANITSSSDRYSGTMNINGGSLNVQGLNNQWGQDGGTITIGGTTLSTIGGDQFSKTGGTLRVLPGADADINSISFWDGGTLDVDGTLELNGATDWAGTNVIGDGLLIQDGNANVTENTTIAVDNYDWDAGTTLILPGITFTIDVNNIEPSSNDTHNADITVSSGTLDVTVADGEWALGSGGDLMLNNTGVGNPVLNGVTLRVQNAGDIFVDGGADINAEVIFDEGSDMTIQGSGGTVNLDGGTTLNGGDIIDTIDRSLADSRVNNNSPLVVTGESTVNVEVFDWDQSTTTIEPAGHLTVAVNNIESVGLDPQYDNTLTLNSGTLTVTTIDNVTWIMDGVLNMNNTAADIPLIDFGEGIDIGNDAAVNDADLNVGGAGISRIADPIDFNSDADVFIAAGAILELTSIVDFDTQNGANNAEFTGTGTLRIGQSTVNINEPLTINMVGGTVDLDGDNIDTFATINVDAATVINAATIENFGDGNEVIDVDSLNGGNVGSLTVNLDNANASWTLTNNGTLNLTNDNATGNLLQGSDVNLNGTVNVTGDVRTTARVDIGATGVVNIQTANEPFRLGNGSVAVNTIAGGTINGPGLIGADSGRDLYGFGTINAAIDFDGTAQLRADNGTLTVNSAILDVGIIGTNDDDGILDVTNPWNTNVASTVDLNGGELRGADITNDGANGINGDGLVSARVVNNTRIDAENGGTLRITNNNTDYDGNSETGQLNALSGNLEIVNTGFSSFGFDGTARAANGRELFIDGIDLDFNSGATIELTGGTLRSNTLQSIQGTVTVNTNPSRLQTDSTLSSAATVTLNDDLNLDGDTSVAAGASFSGAGSLVNLSGGTLTLANGTASADVAVVLENEGTLVVGGSPGTIGLTDFQQSASGDLELDLEGTGLGDFDRLTLTGIASLDGALDLTLGGGYVPALGDQMNFLSAAGGLVGAFNSIIQPIGMPAGLLFDINYFGTFAQLEVIADVDADGDGDVDGADFLILQRTNPALIPAWQAAYPTPLSGLNAATEAVPEPSSALLLVSLAMAAFVTRRK